MNYYYDKEIKILKRMIDENEVITFDIFDTLVLRNVIEPVDIFKVVEKKYKKKYKKKLEFNFYEKRRKFEMQARIKRKNQEDISFDDIYEEFSLEYGKEISEILKKIELETEQEFIVENKFMKSIYNYAKNKNKKIYLISDMYLSKDILENILKKLSYVDYKEMYVSCESLKTKHHGTLFTYIKEEEKLNLAKWLHIGDNFHSDVQMAIKSGLKGYHYKKLSERACIQNIDSLEESILKAIEINEEYTIEKKEYWNEFGYKRLARMYFYITKWLVNDMKENRRDNIYFLSRDGFIINQVYKLFEKKLKLNLPKSNYLYTSRRAFQYAELCDKNFEELFSIITGYNPQFNQNLTIREVLQNLYINPENKKEKLKKFNLTLDTVLKVETGTLNNSKKFFKEIEKEIREILFKEKNNLIKYLKQENLYSKNEINIFDIGWRGSIQKAMKHFLKKKINGYYLGTTQFLHEEIAESSNGFLFKKGLPIDISQNISNNLMMYEFFFSASQGSLINFEEVDGIINPNLKNVEKNELVFEAINLMQESSLRMIDKFLDYYHYFERLDEKVAIKNIEEMFLYQQLPDLEAFSKLTNSVGFGNSDDVKSYVSKEYIGEYVNFEHILNDRVKFNLWPGAILIEDDYGRVFTRYEIDKIFDRKINNTINVFNEKINKRESLRKAYSYYRRNGLKNTIKKVIKVIKS